MKQLIISILFSLVLEATAQAQMVRVRYRPSVADILNPERGFYIPTGTKTDKFIPLTYQQLYAYRTEPQQPGKATYSVRVSLLYRGYELNSFTNGPLSASFLENLQKDFDVVRKTGLKIILRFAYTNETHAGNCKDEYNICPPYGDAPRHIVMQHVQQLKPLLQKNADVIAVLQQGFIGIWGENYFTDHFGSGTNEAGTIADSSWLHRNQFLKSLLDALPADRMVQVRTPQIKQKYINGPHAPINTAALTLAEAFGPKDKARIGFHNDCFLAGEDDYGTFYDYGSSVSKRDTANRRLRRYFEADSRYVAVGGETCDDAFSPQNDCGPGGNAEKEMRAMHYSYLNAAYNNQVNNDWDSAGCMLRIRNELGYRLALKDALLPSKIKMGSRFNVHINLMNSGYAAPYNPRPVLLILRNQLSGKLFEFSFKTDIRKWFSGAINLQQRFKLPANFPKGKYDLLISLPDKYENLKGRPEYAIQLANRDVWEPGSGFNKLNCVLEIE